MKALRAPGPPSGPCFLVFVFSRPPTASDPPGRALTGESITLRPGAPRGLLMALQNEAEESGATEEEATGGRTTRVGRPRGGMRVAARIGDRLRREIRRGRRPRVGDG